MVVSPARTAGWATSQRRKGRFVATPSTSVSASAPASRSSASTRVSAVRDQLRDHRVIGDADLVALLDAGIDADPGWQPQPLEPAGLGKERARVLRVQPHLDCMASKLWQRRQRAAFGELELGGDEVEPGDELRDRVLHLDATVELQEEELAAVEDELGGAGAAVRDCPGERDRRLAHRRAQHLVERRRGRLLQHLLVAALHRALALAERHRPRPRRRAAGSRRAGAVPGTARRTRCRRRTPPSPPAVRRRERPPARRPSGRPACRGRRLRRQPSPAAGSRGPPGRLLRAPERRCPGRPVSRPACRRRPATPPGWGRRRSVRPPRPPLRSPRSRPGSRTRGGSRRRRRREQRGCAPPSGGRTRSRPSRPLPACAGLRRRPERRPPPSRSRARGRCGRCAPRSRHGSRPGASGSASRGREYGLCRRAQGGSVSRGERGWRRACGSRSRRARSRPACAPGRRRRSTAGGR